MRVPVAIDWRAPELDRAQAAGRLFRNMHAPEIASRVGGKLCYLAAPYSHITVDQAGNWIAASSERAGMMAAEVAAYLAVAGITAVSPITLADAMVRAGHPENIDPLDQQFWTAWCAPLLRACKIVIVPELDGWQESRGVWFEVRNALARNCRVFILSHPNSVKPDAGISSPSGAREPLAAPP